MATETNNFFDVSDNESVERINKVLKLIEKHCPEIEQEMLSEEEFFFNLGKYLDDPKVKKIIEAVEQNLKEYSFDIFRIGIDEPICGFFFAKDYQQAIVELVRITKNLGVDLCKIDGGETFPHYFTIYEYAGGRKA